MPYTFLNLACAIHAKTIKDTQVDIPIPGFFVYLCICIVLLLMPMENLHKQYVDSQTTNVMQVCASIFDLYGLNNQDQIIRMLKLFIRKGMVPDEKKDLNTLLTNEDQLTMDIIQKVYDTIANIPTTSDLWAKIWQSDFQFERERGKELVRYTRILKIPCSDFNKTQLFYSQRARDNILQQMLICKALHECAPTIVYSGRIAPTNVIQNLQPGHNVENSRIFSSTYNEDYARLHVRSRKRLANDTMSTIVFHISFSEKVLARQVCRAFNEVRPEDDEEEVIIFPNANTMFQIKACEQTPQKEWIVKMVCTTKSDLVKSQHVNLINCQMPKFLCSHCLRTLHH